MEEEEAREGEESRREGERGEGEASRVDMGTILSFLEDTWGGQFSRDSGGDITS